jgi:hypothetical protein
MIRPRKILASSLLILGGAAAGIFAFIAWADRHVDTRLSELKRELGHPVFAPHPRQGQILLARLVVLDADLEQRIPSQDGFGSPGKWGPDRRAELEKGLASLGSFLEQVDTLLVSSECREYLERGLAAGKECPWLVSSRHRTNVLCAQALVEFEGPGGSAAAANRLGQALDLISLEDDRSFGGYLVSTANEDIVLLALKRMILDPRAQVHAIREKLHDRLERIVEPARFEWALRADLDHSFEMARVFAEKDWPSPLEPIGELLEKHRLADCLQETIALSRMSGVESQHRLYDAGKDVRNSEGRQWAQSGFWLPMADQSHLIRVRRSLALAALDVATRMGDSQDTAASLATLPCDPYTGKPFRIDEKDGGFEVRADDALAAISKKPGQPGTELLCWTIAR